MDLLLKHRAESLKKIVANLVGLAEDKLLPLDDLDVQIGLLTDNYKSWESLWGRYEIEAENDTTGLATCLKLKSEVDECYTDGMNKVYIHRKALAGEKQVPVARGGQPHLKLPEVRIEPFGGDVTDWSPFWTSFNDLVHTQPISEFSITAKYQLLVKSLQGNAKELVKSYPATLEGYSGAINCLKEHYANPNQLVSRAVDRLISLEFTGRGATGLMEFKTKVEALIQSWGGLNVDTTHPVISRLVLQKLPPYYRQKVFELVGVSPTYIEIKNSLRSLWEREDFPSQNKTDSKGKGATSDSKSQTSENKPSSETGTKPKGNTNKGKCRFCDEKGHTPSNCTKYKDIPSRIKRLKELGLCTKCADPVHDGECKTIKCFKCKAPHHSWLHS